MHDLIIVGAGPAGLGASIYASRYKLEHVVIGNEIGGQITEAWEIENYAGFESISGKELMEKFSNQTKKLGAEIIPAVVVEVNKKDDSFDVVTSDGKSYISKSIIFALGMKARKANITGEDDFIGKGVSYCATCDAMFFREKEVVVIGGGDSAATAALHLSEFASKVTLMYRGDQVKFEPAWKEKIEKNEKIEIILNSEVKEIKGEGKVSAISYEQSGPASTREDASPALTNRGESTRGGEKKELPVQGVFIEIGTVPGVEVAKKLGIETDDQDYIIVDSTQKTNLDYVYASGDVTTASNKFRQVITAVAEGAVAAGSVYKKIKLEK